MPRLGDYLGTVLSEIERARMQADVEAIRLADLYAKDPLLQHFPVPRFRVINMRLEIPVAVRGDISSLQKVTLTSSSSTITNLPSTQIPSSPLQSLEVSGMIGLSLSKVKSIAIKGFQSNLKKSSLGSDENLDEHRVKIEAVLQRRISKFDLQGAVPVSVTYMVDELANTLRKELPSGIAETEREKIITEFKESTRSKLLILRPEPASVEVIVDSAELREISPPEALTRIALTIVEEGMEWRQSDDLQGDISSRLRPE